MRLLQSHPCILQRRRWCEVCTCAPAFSCNPRRAITSAAPFTATPFLASATVTAADAASSAASPPPSTTQVAPAEIGGVTRLSVRRNASVASSWETVPNWCELCTEPTNSWDQHVGKREHLCLEMTLNAMVACPRAWAPTDVWWQTELFREHYTRHPRGQPHPPSAKLQRLLRAGLFVPAEDSPLNFFYEAFDAAEPQVRRDEIFALAAHLKEKGFLRLSPECFGMANAEGQSVLFKEVMPLIARVFPESEVRHCSALMAMIYSSFNLETTFFLCGLAALVPPELVRSRVAVAAAAYAKDGGVDGGNTAEAVAGSGDDSDDTETSADEGIPITVSSGFVRAILGSLRWSLEPDVVPPPPALYEQPLRHGYYATLASRLSRLLLTDLVANRVSEYVSRMEGVLRSDRGLQLLRTSQSKALSLTCAKGGGNVSSRDAAQMRAVCSRRLVPHLPNHGVLEFTNGIGLRAANVLGNTGSDHAIYLMEERRALRLKLQRQGKLGKKAQAPPSRHVRQL